LTRSGYAYLGRDAPGRLAQLEMLMADGEASDDEVGP
jgi:hypothetical protein